MTEAMPFLRKLILLSYDPRPFAGGYLLLQVSNDRQPPESLHPDASLPIHDSSMGFMVQYCAFMPRTSTRMSRLAG